MCGLVDSSCACSEDIKSKNDSELSLCVLTMIFKICPDLKSLDNDCLLIERSLRVYNRVSGTNKNQRCKKSVSKERSQSILLRKRSWC